MALLYWERRRLLREQARTTVRNDAGAARNVAVALRSLPHWRWLDRRWWTALAEE